MERSEMLVGAVADVRAVPMAELVRRARAAQERPAVTGSFNSSI